MAQLKGLLAGEELNSESPKDHQRQVNKLMTELQQRRKLGWVKNIQGQVLHDPLHIAEALVQHWSGVSVSGLQNVKKKWVMNILCIQVKQFFQ